MNNFLEKVNITISTHLYLKDPNSSDLGQKIIRESINMIYEMGFEMFNFKKLAQKIQTTEASVYRYFESKHSLLLYLINWYWGIIEYRLIIESTNISNPKERLIRMIHALTSIPNPDNEFVFSQELKLKRVVINEAAKAFLTKEVDKENNAGAYKVYKSIVARVVNVISEVSPNYPFPAMLVSMLIEGSNQQRFFGEHLPHLTNILPEKDAFEDFALDLVTKTLGIYE